MLALLSFKRSLLRSSLVGERYAWDFLRFSLCSSLFCAASFGFSFGFLFVSMCAGFSTSFLLFLFRGFLWCFGPRGGGGPRARGPPALRLSEQLPRMRRWLRRGKGVLRLAEPWKGTRAADFVRWRRGVGGGGGGRNE